MGGTISVTSHKQEGSRFTVTVPFQLVTDDEEQEWERKRQNLLKGFQVLVVDDDPSVGRQTSMILDDIGAKKRGGWTPVSAPFRKWKTPSGRTGCLISP